MEELNGNSGVEEGFEVLKISRVQREVRKITTCDHNMNKDIA